MKLMKGGETLGGKEYSWSTEKRRKKISDMT